MRIGIALLLAAAIIAPGSANARPALDAQVDSIMASMTLDERVGQLFMVSIFGQGLPEASGVFLRDMMPGAVALFNYNGTTPADFTQTINAWQTVAIQVGGRVPLLVAIDQEGGPVTRLTNGFTALPWGAALGAMPPEDARKVGQIAAEELRAIGVTMNLAPVVDVRVPDGPFIERRTLGHDPLAVGTAASAYVQGLQDRGVIGVLKHFPGHGPAGDSHSILPTVNYPLDHVNSVELAPFRIAIQNGAEVVMVGHLVYPALDPTPGLPASLSPVIINDILRTQLGFDGLIMTDAMDMGAIADHFTRPVAAAMAIRAGIDMIASGPHMPMSDQLGMKQGILDAVKRGDLSEARVEEAVRRILTLKAKRGLLNWLPLDPNGADKRINVTAHQPIVDAIYLNTIAIAEDSGKRLPLAPGAQKVAVIFPGVYPAVQRECAAIDPPFKAFAYTLSPPTAEQQSARSMARDADVVLIFTFNIDDYPAQAVLVNAVPAEKAVVVSLQNPYDIERGIHPAAYVAAFNSYPPAFKAVCAVLYGKHPAVGRWTLSGN
jgi:beta-N-acetylhexosaminidase